MQENAMLRPLTASEQFDELSDDEIYDLHDCVYCGEKTIGKYKKQYIHAQCWRDGKSDK